MAELQGNNIADSAGTGSPDAPFGLKIGGDQASAKGYKNYLVNGDFTEWDYGASRRYVTSTLFGPNRWKPSQSQSSAVIRIDAYSLVPKTNYALRVLSSDTTEAPSGTRMKMAQLVDSIESAELIGEDCNFAFFIRFSHTTPSSGSYGNFNYGIVEFDSADPAFSTATPDRTTQNSITDGSFPTTWTELDLTVTTAGTMRNVGVIMNMATVSNTTASDDFYYQVARVRLTKGSKKISANFDFSEITTVRCQKFLPYRNGGATYTIHGRGGATSTTSCKILIHFQTLARTVPTTVSYSGNLELAPISGSAIAVTAISVDGAQTSKYNAYLTVTVASGLTAGAVYTLRNSNDATAYLQIETEL